VDLAGKWVEGMHMNKSNYLVNELEKDCREAHHLGYEFHYSWLIMLITFVAWNMPKGDSFPDIEPTKLLAAHFSTLIWYTNDMTKQWHSNVLFHKYYHQLKVTIESFPCMTPHTLHQYRPIEKFCTDPNFIYITA
jgi:hypothetical protein